jgi:hypothetical protein
MLMSTTNAPAKLHYMPYSFRVVSAGDYVICAETGAHILLDDLRYWSIERQEPYADADASTRAEVKARLAKGLSR